MATQLASFPWTVDYLSLSNTNIFNGYMQIIRIAYTGYTSANHTLEVQDGNGRTICFLRGNPELDEIESYFSGWVQGLRIPVLQSALYGGGPNMVSGQAVIQPE